MIVAINYANEPYRNAQIANTSSAYKNGKVDKVIEFSPNDIDFEFKSKYSNILNESRGAGLWLWKPYFCLKALEMMKEGDYIIYSDSGAIYLNDVRYFIKAMKKRNSDILCFDLGSGHKERCYTQPKTFEILNCTDDWYKESNQRLATFICFKKSSTSVSFIKRWLSYACDIDAIKAGNYEDIVQFDPEFIKHLEDQSIFSLITKKDELCPARNPSQWGNGRGIITIFRNTVVRKKDREYPTMFLLHRQKDYNRKVALIIMIQNIFPRLFDGINAIRKKQGDCHV